MATLKRLPGRLRFRRPGRPAGRGAGRYAGGQAEPCDGQESAVRRGAERGGGADAAGGVNSSSRPGGWEEAVERGPQLAPVPGRPPDNRRQQWIKLLWVGLWMVYLSAPLSELVDGAYGPLGTVFGWLGLAGYMTSYLLLIFRHRRGIRQGTMYAALSVMLAFACALSLGLGEAWLVLFVYLAVTIGATLPVPQSRWAICGSVVVLVALGLSGGRAGDDVGDLWPQLVIPATLGGFAMTGLRQMVSTTKELREARATVAQLAASEERLRLARDLHDLLGHSLSLITLKSELAGRMLPAQPEAAAAQVADIEQVSRQALVDVREAVSDYRRPTLKVELASARTTLAAAGIRAELPQHIPSPSTGAPVDPGQECALAWALREATTNVVRHSGATRCTVTLTAQADDTVCLTVTDNGRGPSEVTARTTDAGDVLSAGAGSGDGTGGGGNGLTGLAERLALADGSLETGAGVRGGFQLRAVVPALPRTDTTETAAPHADESATVRSGEGGRRP